LPPTRCAELHITHALDFNVATSKAVKILGYVKHALTGKAAKERLQGDIKDQALQWGNELETELEDASMKMHIANDRNRELENEVHRLNL
jgi:hypothetical protein